MRSDIRNIRYMAKSGAFGRSEAVGFYVYGKRRDGRTVPCKSTVDDDGGITIYSHYAGSGQFLEEDVTEFTAEEWSRVRGAVEGAAVRICNDILDGR